MAGLYDVSQKGLLVSPRLSLRVLGAVASLVTIAMSPAFAQGVDCSKYELSGVSVGMGHREVWDVLGGKGDKRGTAVGPL